MRIRLYENRVVLEDPSENYLHDVSFMNPELTKYCAFGLLYLKGDIHMYLGNFQLIPLRGCRRGNLIFHVIGVSGTGRKLQTEFDFSVKNGVCSFSNAKGFDYSGEFVTYFVKIMSSTEQKIETLIDGIFV